MDIKILVAAHKEYEMPKDTNLYVPVFVGKALHPGVTFEGYTGDDTGQNISIKNGSYNELTAIYWAWKNLSADAIGLDHYRRYLSLNRKKEIDLALTKEQVENLFDQTDIIVPQKRKYYIQSNYDHYIHAHHREPLDETRDVIKEMYPDYLKSYDRIMKRTSAHMFNMFIMRYDKFDEYCSWMFDVLNLVEKRTNISDYSVYEKRVYGFISELLLDVWLDYTGYSYKEVYFVHMESQQWIKKGLSFVLRMFKKPEK
ncbi:DUF4422 domain-containing protein [Paucilactobacillus suebicus]|uniref:Glycosyltransferase n=1 Tax=Paucilactobacillus suebicus DSM 5007 = KCTC 3549 TaxID=1423807 RepID=A0A0R1WGX1_9LACO|nr:DUF4422 domain-containing protein [Paucilactobacillus suebicus]KRM13276.1 glycosyltransferase [Paucilactobacillus suebicus DSM 5007 = KCTC 3549]